MLCAITPPPRPNLPFPHHHTSIFQFIAAVTPAIQLLLDEINALKIVFATLPDRPDLEPHLQRRSLLKSALFSARFEGIHVQESDPQASRKVEVSNLISAYSQLRSGRFPAHLSVSFIRSLHRFTLRRLSSQAGRFRQKPWAIYNSAGVAVYLAPAYFKLPLLLESYVKFVNHLTDAPPVKVAIAQFIFEKIHPFADGNGRVGRLISSYLLSQAKIDPKNYLTQEEYIENHRQAYCTKYGTFGKKFSGNL